MRRRTPIPLAIVSCAIMRTVYVLGVLLCLVLCSCSASSSHRYLLRMVVLQVTGTPSPPALFEWSPSSADFNKTYPDTAVAFPSKEEMGSVTNREDIGVITFSPEVLVAKRESEKKVQCRTSGRFLLKGMPARVLVSETAIIRTATLHESRAGRVRIDLECRGGIPMVFEEADKGGRTYTLAHKVLLELPVNQWCVFRYLDYDGYKPLALKFIAYRIEACE